jgi:cation diffusion facilitator CzcD-associated flavoprotein CzcO
MVFGEPMSFWQKQMPVGMLLRSPRVATDLSDPERRLDLDGFSRATGTEIEVPVPLSTFVAYGRWFQEQVAPDLDTRRVTSIERNGSGFVLELDDGETVQAERVVVAGGIAPFAHRPEVFKNLPSELVSHASEHVDLSVFAGRRVAVVGAGQSALESAALMHESGADVEVLVRAPLVRWLHQRPWMHQIAPVAKLLYAPPDVGPAFVSQIVARPDWFRRLPRRTQDKLAPRSIRAAGSAWLVDRLKNVPISMDCEVRTARASGDRVRLDTLDGRERLVEHVLLGTGYRVDVARYGFLGDGVLASLDTIGGYPKLSRGFESSVRGLHFVGAPAAWSFGPLMRFVAAAPYVAPRVARHIAARRSPASVRPEPAPEAVTAASEVL